MMDMIFKSLLKFCTTKSFQISKFIQ